MWVVTAAGFFNADSWFLEHTMHLGSLALKADTKAFKESLSNICCKGWSGWLMRNWLPYPSQVVVHNVAKPGMVRGHGLQPYTALFVFVFMAVTLHFSFFKGFYYYLFIFALTHSLTQCRYYKIVHGCNVSQCQPKFNPRVHPLTLWQSQLGKLSVLRDSSLLLLQKS